MQPLQSDPLPTNSSLHMDQDEFGRTRVLWHLPDRGAGSHWLELLAVLLVFAFWLAVLFGLNWLALMIVFVPGEPVGLLVIAIATLFWLVPGFGLLLRLIRGFRAARPASIVFGDHALICNSGRRRLVPEGGWLADWKGFREDTARVWHLARQATHGWKPSDSLEGQALADAIASLPPAEREWLIALLGSWTKGDHLGSSPPAEVNIQPDIRPK